MEELKVLMLCCSRFAYPAMHLLAYAGQLKAVVIPMHCEDMYNETLQLLKETSIPVYSFTKKEFAEETIKLITEKEINLGLVLTFSYIIPRSVFQIPAKGFYNVHPGPLPQYRGADPIFHQIKNQEKFAGVTIHELDEGMDSGDIVLMEKIILQHTDTYGIMETKLANLAQKQVETLSRILAMGFAMPSKKQDEKKANFYKKQELEELTIKWEVMNADAIVALVNACNPYNKGAATMINNKLIKLLSAEKNEGENSKNLQPGTIMALDDDVMEVVAIKNESVLIRFIYLDEGFVTPGYLKQMGLVAGMCFDSTVY